MQALTKGRGAPLHGMGKRLVLDVVEADEMVPFLERRAKAAGKRLPAATGRLLYLSAEAVPNYVQQLALAAFEAAGGEATSTTATSGWGSRPSSRGRPQPMPRPLRTSAAPPSNGAS